MTPNEMNEIIRRIKDELARETRPLRERADNHSKEIKAVREEYGPAILKRMEESNHEQDSASVGQWRITEQSLIAIRDTLADYGKKQNEQSEQIAEVRREQREQRVLLATVPPAAENAEKAALVTQGTAKATHEEAKEAATRARNVDIDMREVKRDTARSVAWWRHPAFAVVIGAVVAAILNHYDPRNTQQQPQQPQQTRPQ